MATIPLMSDQDLPAGTEADVELGRTAELPSYEDVLRSSTTIQMPTADPSNTPSNTSGNVKQEWLKANRAELPLGKKRQQRNDGGMFSRYLHDVDDASAVAFAQLSIRLGFLRKVFGILAFQFLATLLVCTVLYMTPHMKGFIQQQPWIPLGALFGSLALLFAMFVHARTVPLNYFLLTAWTALQAITIGSIVSFYDAEVVIQAVILTSVVVVGLFVYTLQSKRDFNKFYAVLFTFSITFLMATMIQVILMSPLFNFAMSLLGALLFSLYLIFDIDALMHYHSEEDYIIACISIYMDVMGLFLRILQILNELNRS